MTAYILSEPKAAYFAQHNKIPSNVLQRIPLLGHTTDFRYDEQNDQLVCKFKEIVVAKTIEREKQSHDQQVPEMKYGFVLKTHIVYKGSPYNLSVIVTTHYLKV